MSDTKHSKLFRYLRDSGALQSGDETRIREAKRNYRREYMKEYKRQYRTTHAETRITLDAEEHAAIDRAAHQHGMERPHFIKQATLAYIRRRYIVPDRHSVAKVEQGIASIASDLRTLARSQTTGLLDRAINYRKLSERVDRLEAFVHERLCYPPELEEFLKGEGTDEATLTKRIREILEL
jgi:hypothetical protein